MVHPNPLDSPDEVLLQDHKYILPNHRKSIVLHTYKFILLHYCKSIMLNTHK